MFTLCKNRKYNKLRNILFERIFLVFVNLSFFEKIDFPFYFRIEDTRMNISDIQNKKIPSLKNILFRDQQIPSFHRSTYVLSRRRFSIFIKFLPLKISSKSSIFVKNVYSLKCEAKKNNRNNARSIFLTQIIYTSKFRQNLKIIKNKRISSHLCQKHQRTMIYIFLRYLRKYCFRIRIRKNLLEQACVHNVPCVWRKGDDTFHRWYSI